MSIEKSGIIFDIQRLCVQDGPGIRTTVFFKGCPLRCLWCHNPESLLTKRQLVFRSHKCAQCGSCMTVCPNRVHTKRNGIHIVDFSKCTGCGKCIRVCCYDALELLGKRMNVNEVVDAVEIDRPYFKTGGGVTLSGGEPMAQPAFAIDLSEKLQARDISVAMETCGYGSTEQYRKIAPFIDLFLYDYKATGDDLHRKLTGVDQGVILKNLAMLNDMGKPIILRCPMIPGLNDSEEHLAAIADLAKKQKSIVEVNILPYHKIGETKRIQLGEEPSLKMISPPDMDIRQKWMDQLRKFGCHAEMM